MALTFTASNSTTSSSEADLFTPVTTAGYHGCHIFLHNMTGTDVFVIKVYTRDSNATAAFRLFDTITVTAGTFTDVAKFIPMIPTEQYKVTIQRTAGSDRVVNFVRVLQT